MSQGSSIEAAAEAIWRDARRFLAAAAADNPELLEALASATDVGVFIEVDPRPRIGVAGTIAGQRFSQTFDLMPPPGATN